MAIETPSFSREMGLSIVGLGTQYPPYSLKSDAIEALGKRFHPDSPALARLYSINRITGIEYRSSIGEPDDPAVNQPSPPSIAKLHELFVSEGVPLAVSAAAKALTEAFPHLPASPPPATAVAPSLAADVICPTAATPVPAAATSSSSQLITHLVTTTCTDSANPGFDQLLAKRLGLPPSVEKVLLHGVGCSGGLAALRTAANLALGHAMRGRPARILVVALEVTTTLVRSELESCARDGNLRIGPALFSDCASAAVLTNGLVDNSQSSSQCAPPIYDLLGWEHDVIPDTDTDLGFDVDPLGWKVVLSPRVPKLTREVLEPTFRKLLASIDPGLLPPPGEKKHAVKPSTSSALAYPRSSSPGSSLSATTAPPPLTTTTTTIKLRHLSRDAADFDWAMHPGGAAILTGAEQALGISSEHMRASYVTYMNHGNSSSATNFSVLDRLRGKDMDSLSPGGRLRDHVVACAFGPGIAVEMCMLRRRQGITTSVTVADGGGGGGELLGVQTPPLTDSEVSSNLDTVSVDGEEEGEEEKGKGKIEAEEHRDNNSTERKKGATIEEALDVLLADALEDIQVD